MIARILKFLTMALVVSGLAACASEQAEISQNTPVPKKEKLSHAKVPTKGRWQQVDKKANCAYWVKNPRPSLIVTVKWTGACVSGKVDGDGRLVLRQFNGTRWWEAIYIGTIRNGKEHGHGTLETSTGHKYEGNFTDGLYSGQGAVVLSDGSRYQGEFLVGEPYGRGVYVWANGNRYEGDFRNGKQHGRGVFSRANGNNCKGDWRKGRLMGIGAGWRQSDGRFMKCYLVGNIIKFRTAKKPTI